MEDSLVAAVREGDTAAVVELLQGAGHCPAQLLHHAVSSGHAHLVTTAQHYYCYKHGHVTGEPPADPPRHRPQPSGPGGRHPRAPRRAAGQGQDHPAHGWDGDCVKCL